MTKKEKEESAQLRKEKLQYKQVKQIIKTAFAITDALIKEKELTINKKHDRTNHTPTLRT